MEDARFIIGIDLGTTNSCVAYVDTDLSKNPALSTHSFAIQQLVAPGLIEARALLPSFCYLSGEGEFPAGTTTLPWGTERENFVGVFARERGVKVPTRVIQSAKSWLCNGAANRRDPILPFEAAEEGRRLSPVAATAAYLRHILEAWNAQVAKGDPASAFEQQEVVLTVPASFDEVARLLTVEAAKQAGFGKLSLLEEPQAAFYSWIWEHEKRWQQELRHGDVILVCDVGGGTTDFSLIEVTCDEAGKPSFQRRAVGEHLLLGGDNIDQMVAHLLEAQLQEQGHPALDPTQWGQLIGAARALKENLLGEQAPERDTVVLQGRGAQVVGGSRTLIVERDLLRQQILDGFFVQEDFAAAARFKRTAGLRTMGLPYEMEPAITRHLAHFLQKAGRAAPRFVLFNGGTMKPPFFRNAILDSLARWFGERPSELNTVSLDLAVSRGAAYFGKVRRGLGVRIGGGVPRAYYLQVHVAGETEPMAMTLLEKGSEEGTEYAPETLFHLTPNTPVLFRLFSSQTRLTDRAGDVVAVTPEEFSPLPPIQTVLRYGKGGKEPLPVQLHIVLTEIGLLEIWLQSTQTEHKWRLEFQVRASSGEENILSALQQRQTDQTYDITHLENAKSWIQDVYAGKQDPKELMSGIEKAFGESRQQWSPSVLRGLFDVALEQGKERQRSLAHEARWWNLIGFLLRPGLGYPLDDHRIKALWKIILSDYKIAKPLECQIQRWICYRRIAGGLNQGQQTQLVSDLLPSLLTESKERSNPYEYSEKVRTVAAMELLDVNTKVRLGNLLVKKIQDKKAAACDYWALGRVGARHLWQGTLSHVVPRERCRQWLEVCLASPTLDKESATYLIEQLARKVDQRELNLPQEFIERLLHVTQEYPEKERLHTLLTHVAALTEKEQEHVLGEQLPPGLALYRT